MWYLVHQEDLCIHNQKAAKICQDNRIKFASKIYQVVTKQKPFKPKKINKTYEKLTTPPQPQKTYTFFARHMKNMRPSSRYEIGRNLTSRKKTKPKNLKNYTEAVVNAVKFVRVLEVCDQFK